MATTNICKLRWNLYNELKTKDSIFNPRFIAQSITYDPDQYKIKEQLGYADCVLHEVFTKAAIYVAEYLPDGRITLLAFSLDFYCEVWTIEV